MTKQETEQIRKLVARVAFMEQTVGKLWDEIYKLQDETAKQKERLGVLEKAHNWIVSAYESHLHNEHGVPEDLVKGAEEYLRVEEKT